MLWNKGIINSFELFLKFVYAGLTGKPYAMMIEPTSICNLRCIFCFTRLAKQKRKNNFMSFGQFKKLIDEIKGHTIYINFWFAGEPLINRELEDMIAYANKNNIITCVSTNATLLSAERIKTIINSGLDKLIISFDGATKETYEKIRVGANFEAVVQNIKNLILAKKKNPFVSLQMVVTKDNEAEVPMFRKLADDMNVDEAYLKSLDIYIEASKQFSPSLKYRRSVKNRIKHCLAKKRSVILCDGTVVPCCFVIGLYPNFGSVFTESFNKVWTKSSYKQFRNDVKRFQEHPLCSKCGCAYDYILERIR